MAATGGAIVAGEKGLQTSRVRADIAGAEVVFSIHHYKEGPDVC
jgi:hypothetical protein